MAIARDSEFIMQVGRHLGTSLTSQEIDLLCLTCDEKDVLRHAARGYFKLVTYDYGDGLTPASFKIELATKYLLLTQDRIVAFDDKALYFFNTKDILYCSVWAQASNRSTEIFCEIEQDRGFLMLGLSDVAATKFVNKINIFRDEFNEDDHFSRLRFGPSVGEELYRQLATEGVLTMDQIHEMFKAPEQWGSGTPKDTPKQ